MDDKMAVGIESYWTHEDPSLSDAMKDILIHYSEIPESTLIRHVQTVRDRAWQVAKYPCIGLYLFTQLNSPNLPVYETVLQRVKAGEMLLDLGCCVGQEIRKLIYDGAPAQNIAGLDMDQAVIDVGYDLFKDKGKLQSRFFKGDIFDPDARVTGFQRFNMVMAVYFFHLFNWNEQIEAMRRVVHLLKAESGSLIFGIQLGCENPRSVPHSTSRSGELFAHNPQTWSKLVHDATKESGMSFLIESQLRGPCAFMNNGSQGSDFRWLSYCITVQ